MGYGRAAGFFYADREFRSGRHRMRRTKFDGGRIPSFEWDNTRADRSFLGRIDRSQIRLAQLSFRFFVGPSA